MKETVLYWETYWLKQYVARCIISYDILHFFSNCNSWILTNISHVNSLLKVRHIVWHRSFFRRSSRSFKTYFECFKYSLDGDSIDIRLSKIHQQRTLYISLTNKLIFTDDKSEECRYVWNQFRIESNWVRHWFYYNRWWLQLENKYKRLFFYTMALFDSIVTDSHPTNLTLFSLFLSNSQQWRRRLIHHSILFLSYIKQRQENYQLVFFPQ